MESFVKQIRDNWVILSFIVMLIVSWTTQNTRLTSAENQIEELSVVVTQINQININLATITEHLKSIDEKFSGLK
jgi:hypothetical protein